MFTISFDPEQWVYVNDSMGRLGQGHYKNLKNPHETLTVAENEKKRTASMQQLGSISEQSVNDNISSPEKSELSPWNNPVVGEQKARPQHSNSPKTKVAHAPIKEKKIQDQYFDEGPSSYIRRSKQEDQDDSSRIGSHGGDDKVICSEMVRQGRMSHSHARACSYYAETQLPKSFMDGYQFWAIPYVRLMRKSKLASNIIAPLVHHRTCEVLYRLGKTPKGSTFGRLLCGLHDNFCTVLGYFVTPEDYKTLYKGHKET